MWRCLGVYLASLVQRLRGCVLTGDLIAECLRMLFQHLEVLVFESVADIDCSILETHLAGSFIASCMAKAVRE